MLSDQRNACAICLRPFKIAPHVDHNHAMANMGEAIRSLLCHLCNNGLGNFKDDPVRLRAAAEYIDGGR
jgi:hypothetical protein